MYDRNQDISSLFYDSDEGDQPETEYTPDKNDDGFIPDQEINGTADDVRIAPKTVEVKKKMCKSVTAKIMDDEQENDVEKFEEIKRALWTDVDSDVVKWAIRQAYKSNRKKIKRIIEERNRIEEVKNSIESL